MKEEITLCETQKWFGYISTSAIRQIFYSAARRPKKSDQGPVSINTL